MHLALSVLLLSLSAPTSFAQTKRSPSPAPPTLEQQWGQLIDAHRPDAAEKLCTAWTHSADHETQVEAQKCLANVALSRGSQVSLQGNEVGGGTLGEGYTPAAIDAALVHLNEGLRLAPQDLSIHAGRLHILEVAGRYDAMVQAADESATIYKGPEVPAFWLAYAAELGDMGQPTAGLHLCLMLDKHYPNNSNIIGNIGAFYDMLKQWDKGLPYLRRAAAMHPEDPIDNWNLGWALSHMNLDEEADEWMQKSIQLDRPGDESKERKCLYGQFLVIKRNKRKQGCALVQSSCDKDDRKVCAKP